MPLRPTSLPDIGALLGATDIFAGQEDKLLLEFAERCERVYLAPGQVLMQEGEAADCLYVLVSGRLRVQVRQHDGSEATVGEVSRSEVVGEMAIIADEPRSATVVAIRDSELLRFSRADFEHLVKQHPMAMLKIARQIVVRLRRSIRSQRAPRREMNIAVVPAGDQAPISEFVAELVRGLESIGSTLVLDSKFVEHHLAPGLADAPAQGPQNDQLMAWLNQEESKHQFIVYCADPSTTNWTRRCLRATDRVLTVGHSGGDPAPNRIEAEFLKSGSNKIFAQAELVLVHENDGTRPSGTQRWTSERDVSGCHHVRRGARADYDRLARLLTGRAFGLVLGGGGARGLGHIGVIKAIREIGIPIDAIGGTSMGAIIAGVYALDSNIESVTAACRAAFLKKRSLLDITFPAVALTAGKRITKELEKFFGDTQIEDLWLKYYCVSSNLTQAESNVHQEGSCLQRIRASISLPGILPPVYHDGDLLIDGSVTNNLPVGEMRTLCDGGNVIAVNVSPNIDLKQNTSFGETISGWKILTRGMNPFAEPVDIPSIANVLVRTTLLASANAQAINARNADLCLYPPVSDVGLLDFQALDSLSENSYHYALKELGAWWEATRAKP